MLNFGHKNSPFTALAQNKNFSQKKSQNLWTYNNNKLFYYNTKISKIKNIPRGYYYSIPGHYLHFSIKMINCDSLWLPLERNYSYDKEDYGRTKNQDNLACHFKDITNLVFLGLWACLTTSVKSESINLWKTLMFTCMQKINFILNFFLEILQRFCNLIILSTLGMPGHTH